MVDFADLDTTVATRVAAGMVAGEDGLGLGRGEQTLSARGIQRFAVRCQHHATDSRIAQHRRQLAWCKGCAVLESCRREAFEHRGVDSGANTGESVPELSSDFFSTVQTLSLAPESGPAGETLRRWNIVGIHVGS